MKNKTVRFAPVAAAIIILITLIFSFVIGGASAFADIAASPRSQTVAAYENQNVWDDLRGATIDGEGIDLNLYNFDEHKNVQIISFVEFCYSFYADNRDDYGLYVYIILYLKLVRKIKKSRSYQNGTLRHMCLYSAYVAFYSRLCSRFHKQYTFWAKCGKPE